MRTVSAPGLAPSTQINGRKSAPPEVIFQPQDFGPLCRLIWAKPDTAIAIIAEVSDRAAREYLNGNVAAPAVVIAAIVQAITRRR